MFSAKFATEANQNFIDTTQPKWLIWVAKIISYIFHPLFIPGYVFLFLTIYFPFEFAGITSHKLSLKIFSVFWMTAFFPAFAVFLLWRLGFSNSIFLRTQKERIIPYFITMFFYWWMHYLSKNQTDQPVVLQFFYLGIFYTTIVGVILNNFFKISMHTIGTASAATAIMLMAWFYQTDIGVAIAFFVLINGIVATARFICSNHTPLEIYSGMALGILAQIVAYFVAM
jgi:hypothetical protein